MSRFLFVVPPLTGHINPLRPVAAELAARGHEVAWVGPQPEVGQLSGSDSVFAAGESERFDVAKRPTNLRGFAALKYFWEQYLIPLADMMVPGVLAAVDSFAPDVLVVDQQAMAGPVVAMLRGLPWVTSASTSSELSDPVGQMPKIAAWIDDLQDGLRSRHGAPARISDGPHADLRFSPYLIVAFSTREFAGEPTVPVGDIVRYVGPAIGERHDVPSFDLHLLDGRPLVFVTLGTANAEVSQRFLAEAAQACAGLAPDVQSVIVDPGGVIDRSALAIGDADVIIAANVPQLDIIAKASVVLCHGGHNTVCEALDNGVPLVIAPIRDDQPIIAEQVVNSGVGVRLRFDRAAAVDIETAVNRVLTDGTFAESAAKIRESFRASGGAVTAAESIAALVSAGPSDYVTDLDAATD